MSNSPPYWETILEERGQPHDNQAEKAILGALQLNNSLTEQASSLLSEGDFFIESNRSIYRCMVSLYKQGMDIDHVTLHADLTKRGLLERVGGMTYLASLIDGVPRTDTIASYVRILKKKTSERRLLAALNYASAAVLEGDYSEAIGGLGKALADSRSSGIDMKRVVGFYANLSILDAAEIRENQPLFSCLRRGEVGMLAAISNLGKTTTLLNACLSAAAGEPFFDLVVTHEPLRILYCDFESPASRLREDLNKMLRSLSGATLARENFAVLVDGEIDEQPLNLSRQSHLDYIKLIATHHRADLIVFDTVSAAFNIQNENDNGEITRLMKTVRHLARDLNCAIIFSHHIGKANETQNGESVYKSRGASSFGGMAHTILNLEKDSSKGDGYAVLSCAKSKGFRFEPMLMKLNFDTRWFELCAERPTVKLSLTVHDIEDFVRETGEVKTSQILEQFKNRAGKKTIEDRIREATSLNLIESPKQGKYRIRNAENQEFPESALNGSMSTFAVNPQIRNSYRDCGNAETNGNGSRRDEIVVNPGRVLEVI